MITVHQDRGLAPADLPAGTEWDFGGFAYGLEPVILPEPGALGAQDSFDDPQEVYGQACRLIRLAGTGAVPGLSANGNGETELYWFRWITGHQVSFISWQLMARLAADAKSGRIPAEAALRQICCCVRTYSAMLLYTGSCPRAIYQNVIRPSMRLRHRGFSGTWAPDFWPVRDLLRARRVPFPPSPALTDFLEAITLQQSIHDGIAAKLVPDGASLLRQSGGRGLELPMVKLIYDNYFFTLRAPVSRHQVVTQLLRRLMAITQDVAVNGLYPAGSRAELPAGLLTSEVAGCAEEFTEILAAAACCAAQLPPGREATSGRA